MIKRKWNLEHVRKGLGLVTATALATVTQSAWAQSPIPPVRVPLPSDLPTNGVVTSGMANIRSMTEVERPEGFVDGLVIEQGSTRTEIEWDEFHIQREHIVRYEQPSSSSVAMNRINGARTEIHGSLQANGRVYLLNSNGVLFGEGARVNVSQLVASSLQMPGFDVGSLGEAIKNGDAYFDIDPEGLLTPEQIEALGLGNIDVEEGAIIAVEDGGVILLVAPEINNNGMLSVRRGQVILAAAKDRVYLAESDRDSDNPGLDYLVEVGTGGTVNNQSAGHILANQGGVTAVGRAINQNGRITATTSVDFNGVVRLLARDGGQVLPTGNAGSLDPNTWEKVFSVGTGELPSGGMPVPGRSTDGTDNKFAVTFGEDSITEVVAHQVKHDVVSDLAAAAITNTSVDKTDLQNILYQNSGRFSVQGPDGDPIDVGVLDDMILQIALSQIDLKQYLAEEQLLDNVQFVTSAADFARLASQENTDPVLLDTTAVNAIYAKLEPLLDSSELKTFFQDPGLRAAFVERLVDQNNFAGASRGTSQRLSEVNVFGERIELLENALVAAKGGEINLSAQQYQFGNFFSHLFRLDQEVGSEDPQTPPQANTTIDDSEIILRAGSTLDVSGYHVFGLPMSDNLLEVNVTGTELRDSPHQRNGVLFGSTVYVNLLNGDSTEILDISAILANREDSIQERLTLGGTVDVRTAGSFLQEAGSHIDVSGGSLAYEAGDLASTYLIYRGRLVDLSFADPNLQYDGILGGSRRVSERWGIQSWSMSPLLRRRQEGFVTGRDAGTFQLLVGRSAEINGTVDASVVIGGRQQRPTNDALSNTLNRAHNEVPKAGNFLVDVGGLFNSAQSILISDEEQESTADTLALSLAQLQQSGARRIAIASNRGITIQAAEPTVFSPNTDLEFYGLGGVEVDGSFYLPSGSFTADTYTARDFTVDVGPNDLRMTAGSYIDVSGLWVNDRLDTLAGRNLASRFVDAGDITFRAGGSLLLEEGSQLLANGGGRFTVDGELIGGRGGDITIAAEAVPFVREHLLIGSTLESFSLTEGGTLSLTAPSLYIGSAEEAAAMAASPTAVFAEGLILADSFFQGRGFSAYDLSTEVELLNFAPYGAASGEILVDEGAHLQLQTLNYSTLGSGGVLGRLATGAKLSEILAPELLPADQRAGVSLSLTASTGDNADAFENFQVLGDISVLDNGGNVSLTADHSLFVAGAITVPGGSISLSNTTVLGGDLTCTGGCSGDAEGAAAELVDLARQSIWLADSANLSVVAQPVYSLPRAYGTERLLLSNGAIEDSGDISIDAKRGYVVAQQGSTIDISGNAARFDVDAAGRSVAGGDLRYGQGGSLSITGTEGVYLDGEIKASAATDNGQAIAGASGGSFELTFDPNQRGISAATSGNSFAIANFNFFDARIVVDAQRAALLASGTAFGDNVLQAVDSRYHGAAVVSVEQIQQAGFDSVTLRTTHRSDSYAVGTGTIVSEDLLGRIEVVEGVDLAIPNRLELDTTTVDLVTADGSDAATGSARLAAANMILGRSSGRNDQQTLADGEVVTADSRIHFDVNHGSNGQPKGQIALRGNFQVTGVETVEVDAGQSIGVRGYNFIEDALPAAGSLVTDGDLLLTAAQISPASYHTYNFVAEGNSIITRDSGGTKVAPYSVSGTLNFRAADIDIGSTIQAPLGTLDLQATNRLTASAGADLSVDSPVVTFAGGIQGRSNVFYSAGGNQLVLDSFLEPLISLTAPELLLTEEARVDVSGGGDVLFYQFSPSNQGSRDILNFGALAEEGIDANYFAIIPRSGLTASPYDTAIALESDTTGADLASLKDPVAFGQTIYLEATGDLPAGEYAVLPARYAMLEGAYLVTPRDDIPTIAPNRRLTDTDGAAIVAGYLGSYGTTNRSSQWSAFKVEKGSVVYERSGYTTVTGNEWFASLNAEDGGDRRLPVDAGRVALAAENNLIMAADFAMDSALASFDQVVATRRLQTGDNATSVFNSIVATTNPFAYRLQSEQYRSDVAVKEVLGDDDERTLTVSRRVTIAGKQGQLDITAPDLAVVTERDDGATSVQVLDSELNNTGAGSVLLGAHRNVDGTVTGLDDVAGQVTIADGVDLALPELVLAATHRVDVEAGSTLSVAEGDSVIRQLSMADVGVLLRVAEGDQTQLVDTDAAIDGGVLNVAEGATIDASEGAALFAATQDTVVDGELLLDNASLNVATDVINLGAVEAGQAIAGFLLDQQQLAAFNLRELVLTSTDTDVGIRLFGSFEFNGQSLVLQGSRLALSSTVGDERIVISADDSLQISNPNQVAVAAVTTEPAAGTALTLEAPEIRLGSSVARSETAAADGSAQQLQIAGFEQININAADRLVTDDQLLQVNSDVTINAPLLTSALGGDFQLAGAKALAILGAGAISDNTGVSALAGRMRFDAESIRVDQGATFALPSGFLSFTAAGSEDSTNPGNPIANSGFIDLGQARFYLGGVEQNFAVAQAYSNGGKLALSARAGDITASTATEIDLSATNSTTQVGGSLELNAEHGTVDLSAATINAAGGTALTGQGGAVSLYTDTLSDFSGLSQQLLDAGFDRGVSIRINQGDLVQEIGQDLLARNVSLTADSGNVVLQGQVGYVSPEAGTIEAYGQAVTVGETAQLIAASSEADGGNITLAGVGSGGVTITSGAILDARAGSAKATGGDIRIRIPVQGSQLALDGEFLLSHNDAATDKLGRLYVEAITQHNLTTETLSFAAFKDAFDGAVNNLASFDQSAALAAISTLPEFINHGLVAFLELISEGNVTIDALDLDIVRTGKSMVPTEDMSQAERDEIIAELETRYIAASEGMIDAMYRWDQRDDMGRWDSRTIFEGTFVLRAEGNIVVNEKISDGFVTADYNQTFGGFELFSHLFEATLFENTWSIGLVAGADIASTNTYSVKTADNSNIVLAEEGIIRTGTGELTLVAAGNIEQGFNSAIYTGGKATGTQVNGEGLIPIAYDIVTISLGDLTAHMPYYPTRGGDLNLRAGGDYIAEGSDQFFSNWLHRIGNLGVGENPLPANTLTSINRSPTAWLAIPAYFKQGLATFGGGDVHIQVGGNAYNLTVSSPTEGKYLGDTAELNRATTGSPIPTQEELLADLIIMDSGNIDIDIGDGLYGGAVMIGNGRAHIGVVGDVRAQPDQSVLFNQQDTVNFANLGFIGAVMDGQLRLSAGGNIELETVFNPTVLNQSDIQGKSFLISPATSVGTREASFFFTYSSESALDLESLSGDINLYNSGERIASHYGELYSASATDSDLVGLDFTQRTGGGLAGSPFNSFSTESSLAVLPTEVSVTAFGGNVLFENNMFLYPNAANDLDILAGGTIAASGNAPVDVLVSIINPALLPTVANPLPLARTSTASQTPVDTSGGELNTVQSLDYLFQIPVDVTQGDDPVSSLGGLNPSNTWFSRWLPETPTHADSASTFTVATKNGDINGDANQFNFYLPGETRIRSGGDIDSVTFEIYHGASEPYQLSSIEAMGDIRFDQKRDQITGQQTTDYNRFNIHGGGDLVVSVRGDIVLGAGRGIRSLGNSFVSNLADRGANVTVSAGAPLNANLDAFYASALPGAYRGELIDFVVADSFPDSLADAVSAVTGETYATEAEARAALLGLDQSVQYNIAFTVLQTTEARRQQLFAHYVFYEEINKGGLEATGRLDSKTPNRGDCATGYARACNAIDILFPDEVLTESRIDMVASTIQSREGGDVNLLIPAGSIDVGATSVGNLVTGFDPIDDADRFGILALGSGRINSFSRDNVNVAESRVATLLGGRVMMYSELGSIDAGRGARTAGNIEGYVVREDGTIEPPQQVSGSGIRNASPPGVTAESVNLWAPSGAIDAGEAGISSAGAIFLGAQSVLNADAISADGEVSGTIDLSATGSALSALGSVTSASQAAAESSMQAQTSTSTESEATLTVRLLKSNRVDSGS